MKKFISGLIVGMIIMTTVASFAASKIKEAYFNDAVKLTVDGKTIVTEIATITKDSQVNGSNYVSARALAEAMGGTVAWANNTVVVTTKKQTASTPAATPKPASYSYANPAPLYTLQTIAVKDIFDNYKAEIKVLGILRGQQAWEKIYAAYQYNDPPAEGYEYLLAKIYFKLNDIEEGKAFDLNGIVHIKLVSSVGKEYDLSWISAPEPSLNAKLYKDASNEGYAVYLVKKDDLKPKLTFGRKYDGSGGIWFKAYEE